MLPPPSPPPELLAAVAEAAYLAVGAVVFFVHSMNVQHCSLNRSHELLMCIHGTH
jgi:hypothetical protein